MFTPSTALEADTQAITELLGATQIGQVCTYAAMSDALGRDIRGRFYVLLRAVRCLNRDTGALFGAVRGVGYKRLPAEDAHQIGSHARARIRRTAHRTSKTIGAALDKANDLSPEARRRAVAEVSAMNMLAHLATDRVVDAQAGDDKPPVLAEALRGVMKHLGIGEKV